jgi:hypothetical protein
MRHGKLTHIYWEGKGAYTPKTIIHYVVGTVFSKVVSEHSPGRTEENHEKSKSR